MTDKPEIDFIEGPPPTELQITTLVAGEGPVRLSLRPSMHFRGYEASVNAGRQPDYTVTAPAAATELAA